MSWGCDEPATRPVFDIGCNRCLGSDADCELCGGINRVPQYECPTAQMAKANPLDRMSVDLLMRSYIQLDSRSVLPVAGGFLEQTRGFAAACEIIDSERARIEQIKAEAREREQRAAQARSKQGRR
ncbi:MAG: hypothetical protein ACO4CT_18695 [Planctomycetota bacterium]